MKNSTRRLTSGALTLVRNAAGSPSEMAAKAVRLVSQLRRIARPSVLNERLQRLNDIGTIRRIPSRVQIVVGAIDMLRFWISPAAAEYYTAQGISYSFHQLLRFLDEPASVTDPIGLYSTRDGIIGHLMQVVHANPVYDFELLQMFSDGLDSLESQLKAMIAGTHPRSRSIQAVVEEADYHARLLEFVRQWRNDPSSVRMVRSNVEKGERWDAIERTFGSLSASFRYFNKLPTSVLGAVTHLRTEGVFPQRLAEPA